MPIQFQNTYVNPNVKIAGEEIPLEQLEKTSNVIQGRYDQSREYVTKANEALRVLETSANPIDKEKAKEIRSMYANNINDISKGDDYHRHLWETQGLAVETANNLKTLEQRNKEIQAQEEYISKNTAWGDKRDQRLKEFRGSLTPISWNGEDRTITGANVNAYSAANDVNLMKLAVEYGSAMKPITYKGADGKIVLLDAMGNITQDKTKAIGMGHLNVAGGITKLEAKDVAEAVGGALMEDTGVKAQTERDLNYIFKYENPNNIDPNSKEGQAIRDKYLNDNIYNAASKAGGILRQYQDNRSTNVTYSSAVPDGMFGFGAEPDPNPNNLISTPDKINVEKKVESINKETQDMNASAFNKDGSFKAIPTSIIDALDAYDLNSMKKDQFGVSGTPRKTPVNPNSFDSLVPAYYQKAFGEGMTQKELYNKFQADKANKSKVLMSDWVIADNKRRGTVDANMKAVVGSLPAYKEGDIHDTDNQANQAEIDAAWKSGGVTFNAYTGAITIGSGKEKLMIPLGTVGETNENNYAQIRMNAVSRVTKTLLDVTVPTSYLQGPNKEPFSIPIQDKAGNTLGYQSFIVDKEGAKGKIPKMVDGKMTYVNSPGRITVINHNSDGSIMRKGKGNTGLPMTKEYLLGDGEKPIQFTVDMLNEIVDPFTLE
jgi:hypothetical protein